MTGIAQFRKRGPLRTLFVESGTEMGGAQIALLTMLRALDRNRVAPFYASLGFGAGNLPEQVESLGIPVFRLRAGRFRKIRATFARIAELVRIMRGQAIDIVLANSGHPLLFARPAALIAGRPCACWVHGHFPGDAVRGQAIALALQAVSADALLANSEWTARQLRADSRDACSIRIVRDGIDLTQFGAWQSAMHIRAGHQIPAHRVLVGLFGRLHPFKGQHIFLQAAAALARRKSNCIYWIVGGTPFNLAPGYAESLRRQAEASGLNGNVQFLGQRQDVSGLMQACDIVVHCSVEPEPWGLVVAEAMASGKPVIATAAGGPREMIEDGRTGLLIPPGDASALAVALERLASDPSLRRALGIAARQHAERHFDMCQAAEHLSDELLRVCEAYRPAPWRSTKDRR